MSGKARGAIVVAAIAAAVVAFVVLRPSDDEEPQPGGGQASTAQTDTGGDTAAPRDAGGGDTDADGGDTDAGGGDDADGGGGETSERDAPDARERAEAAGEPEATRIEVRDGAPVGGLQEVSVEKGAQIRIDVDVDAPAELHLHGYDVIRSARPGRPARFRLEADVEGIFELEIEGTHTPVAELRVEP